MTSGNAVHAIGNHGKMSPGLTPKRRVSSIEHPRKNLAEINTQTAGRQLAVAWRGWGAASRRARTRRACAVSRRNAPSVISSSSER
jgi:hypothetical protein